MRGGIANYHYFSVEQLKGRIKVLHRKFNSMKITTIECLEKCNVTVIKAVYFLTAALALVENRPYLKKKLGFLRKSEDHWDLFGKLNFYWNYLSFGLFASLVEELAAWDSAFQAINVEMDEYKADMTTFRKSTTLELFCRLDPSLSQINSPVKAPPEFNKEMVTTHEWPNTVTLEDVEEFRKSFLKLFNLPDCAMVIHSIRRNCFIITWFLVCPDSIVSLIKESPGRIKAFSDFKVISVVINGDTVYEPPPPLSPELVSVLNSLYLQGNNYNIIFSDLPSSSSSG